MKQFIFKITIFILISIILLEVHPLYLIYKDNYKQNRLGAETFKSIEKSKSKNNSNVLIIGDSVGKQLFNNYTCNDTINSLACNRAVTMVGFYLLLNNYIKTGNHPKKVYLIVTPYTLNYNLNQIYTYHYFLKPFYNNEYKSELSELALKQIKKVPYYRFCQIPHILTSNWAPEFENKDSISNLISPISVEYFLKIKKLTEENNIKFKIIPAPTAISQKNKIESLNKTAIVKNNLSAEFKYYLNEIIYLNDTCFRDGTHLKRPNDYKAMYKEKFIK